MPIDRAAILRTAEKLLRQGKLEPAIAEYLRIVEEQPQDWNTANIVGDLYVRSGNPDKAIEQFVRSADTLSDDGALARAAALYKKILKLRPEHEHALLQCAEIAATQGVLIDARTFLRAVADRRRARGDQRGVAQVTVRLASLDAADFPARLAGARARLDLKDQAGAVRDLREIAAGLRDQGEAERAIEALREAVVLVPEDPELRAELLQAFVAAGDHVSAREHARTSEQLHLIASHFEDQGRHDEAITLLEQALAIDPSNARLLAKLNRAPAPMPAGGSAACAAVDSAIVTEEAPEPADAAVSPIAAMGAKEPSAEGPSITRAAQLATHGHIDLCLATVRQFIETTPERRDDVTLFGLSLCDSQPDVAFTVIDLAADTAVAAGDWESAAAGLQEMVTRAPMYLPALMRLVEVSVDGGLEATMFSAQAQLADAYIEAGAAEEARYLAEDLVAREPWDRGNIERFRRALTLLGESDPDSLIAARLSGESPFTSTDVSISAARGAGPVARFEEVVDEAGGDDARPADLAQAARFGADVAGTSEWHVDNHGFAFAATAFDYSSSSFDSPEAAAGDEQDDDAGGEVDLSVDLDDMTPMAAAVSAPAGVTASVIDGVFAGLRNDAARRSDLATAEDDTPGGQPFAIGRVEDSVPLLTSASRAPRLRFVTASLLGRIYRQRGELERAVEWLERAAQAPPTSPDDGRLLLYDLADVLETAGEYTRALAVCMELQADAGDYRDIAERVSRLSAMQMRG